MAAAATRMSWAALDAAGAQRGVAAQLVDLEPERVVVAQLARLGQPLLGPLGVAGEPGGVGRGVAGGGRVLAGVRAVSWAARSSELAAAV